jgi:DNA-binding transcriptional LysR family regulator
MRITHLRKADLNLLVAFAALAEERNVTRAASRLLLTQPAVSRALQRLRETFRDDLLVRAPSGYEPTPKGKRLLQELSTMLPRLDRLLSGEDFDPQVEETTFRVAVTDHASHVLCPLMCRKVLPKAGKVSIEFVSFGDQTFEAIEKGRIDLMLNADDGYLPPPLCQRNDFRGQLLVRRGERNEVSTGAHAEAVSCCRARRRWNLERTANPSR